MSAIRDAVDPAVTEIAVLPSPGETSLDAAERLKPDAFLVIVVAWVRVTYVITGVLVITARGHRAYSSVAEQWLLLLGATVWAVVQFRVARRAGRFSRGWTWADMAVAVVLMLLVTRMCVPMEKLSWGNWAFTFGLSSALTAGVAFGVAECAAAVALLLGSFVVALWPASVAHQLQVTNLIGNPLEFVWFAGVALLASRYLRRTEARLDAAVTARIKSESQSAALRARYTDRVIHYGVLHDTVLSTLTAIARGGLDHRIREVQARCAREADFLRRLIQGDLGNELSPVPGLDHALSEVASEAEEFGIRVHCLTDSVPELPGPVVNALGQATREALNNVRRHSGASEAWVTALGEGDTVTVTIVDRGCGFDQQEVRAGFGIRQSILDRMAQANGAAAVISAAGRNTLVELRWPA